MAVQTISLWGDSIGKGVIYDEVRGRYAILKENCVNLLSKKLNCAIENHAVMGATASQGVERMRDDFLHEGGLAVIEFGGNDCNFQWNQISDHPENEHFPNTLPDAFEQMMRKAIRTVKEKGAQAIVALAPPIVTDKFFSFICKGNDPERIMKWLKTTEALYRRQEYYTHLSRRIAQEEECQCLDLRSPFLPLR